MCVEPAACLLKSEVCWGGIGPWNSRDRHVKDVGVVVAMVIEHVSRYFLSSYGMHWGSELIVDFCVLILTRWDGLTQTHPSLLMVYPLSSAGHNFIFVVINHNQCICYSTVFTYNVQKSFIKNSPHTFQGIWNSTKVIASRTLVILLTMLFRYCPVKEIWVRYPSIIQSLELVFIKFDYNKHIII